MINPGRFGNWKELKKAKTGDKGMDWPYNAMDSGVVHKVRLPDAVAEGMLKGFNHHEGWFNVCNKEWLCIVTGH